MFQGSNFRRPKNRSGGSIYSYRQARGAYLLVSTSTCFFGKKKVLLHVYFIYVLVTVMKESTYYYYAVKVLSSLVQITFG